MFDRGAWTLGGFLWLGLTSLVGAGPGLITQQAAIQQADGSWQLRVTVSKSVCVPETYTFNEKYPVTKKVTEEVDGKTVVKEVTEYQTVTKQATRMLCKTLYEQMQLPLDLATLNAYELDGRKIPAADLETRVSRRPLLVALAPTTEKVPEYLTSVFLPGTVVIMMPKAVAAAPVGIPSAPVGPQPVIPQPAVPQPAAPQPAVPNPAVNNSRPTEVTPVAFAPDGEKLLSPLPKTLEPQLVFVGREGSDLVKVREMSDEPSTVQVKTVKKNGSSITQSMMTAKRLTRTTTTTLLPLTSITFLSPLGQPLPAERVKERLGAGDQPALLAHNGGEVDPFWLQNVKPTVLVLSGFVLPEAYPSNMAQPAMMSAPVMMPSQPPAVMPPQAPTAPPVETAPPVSFGKAES